ncbi:MAG: dihydropteroate synthase [Desulfomonilia bacterium]|nr:dihydropteroate synthase [Desulfomonilia bacterium]
MDQRSNRSSKKGFPRARLLTDANEDTLLACGVDPASLPYLAPKLIHRNLLIKRVKLFAANILKQSMLSIGGDVAVNRNVISGKTEFSDCLLMGDLRHFSLLLAKLSLQKGLEAIAQTIQEQIFSPLGPLCRDFCSHSHTWRDLPVIMGILNVTPDSFSDGGLWLDPSKAIDYGIQMEQDGADLIDVGGESSRPGAQEVGGAQEISRVIPIIESLATRVSIPISIDTTKAEVARAAIDAGATVINDISALSKDPDMMELARSTGAGVVLMHMRGSPETMQENTSYEDIIDEIITYLDLRIESCLDAGIRSTSLIVDPGMGFAKTHDGNLCILHHIAEFRSLGVPVMLGHSRKSTIGSILDCAADDREEGTDAVSAWAIIQGVDFLRVHDVKRAFRMRKIISSIRAEKP